MNILKENWKEIFVIVMSLIVVAVLIVSLSQNYVKEKEELKESTGYEIMELPENITIITRNLQEIANPIDQCKSTCDDLDYLEYELTISNDVRECYCGASDYYMIQVY